MPEWLGIFLLLWLWAAHRTTEYVLRGIRYSFIKVDGFSQKTLAETEAHISTGLNDWQICVVLLFAWPWCLWSKLGQS